MDSGAPSSNDPPPPPGLAPRVLVVRIVAGLFMVSFAVVLVAVLLFYFRRRRDRRITGARLEHGERATLPAGTRGDDVDPFPAETLPAFAYCARDRSGEHECAVCLGAVREGEMVRRLPACLHVYHVECIDRWLATHRTCPVCRSKLDHPRKPAR
ncbi:hypothetical protein QOZ80_6BG0495230 [Eleusine coracana subsp. coracana]|nr:hypothetical protein QOZ80_6BG0495230 [Eleusine coracana subsp. coracana]